MASSILSNSPGKPPPSSSNYGWGIAHRPHGRLAKHFHIQLLLSGAVCLLVLIYHFLERVQPGFSLPWSNLQFSRALPYLLAPIVVVALIRLQRHYRSKDEEFQKAAPGISI